ncbi:MAG: hypothetical protein HY706_08940 [Candidatus Hydrogenedentes bacterium]|nr:hypothetical protein [Candidatus Hydrogenedentota bacterium]
MIKHDDSRGPRRRLRFAVNVVVLCSVALGKAAFGEDAQLVFEKDVFPILQENCSGCHFPGTSPVKAKLDLSTAASALRGGESGPAIVPGQAAESRLVQLIEHKIEPFMPPPKKGQQLSPAQIDVIRKWIDHGAKAESAQTPNVVAASADSEPSEKASAPPDATSLSSPSRISSLAFASLGTELVLAQGGLHTVVFAAVSPEGDQTPPKYRLGGHAEMVRAMAFSPDGTLLAAAGGKPGRSGEIKIWQVSDQTLLRTIEGHRDNILSAAFSPDGKRLATGSYDKTVGVWSIETSEEIYHLTQHVDAVYAVAFSPDGRLLASGAGDRTIKVWDADSGRMLITLSDSLDAVLTLAFSPSGQELAGAGADKIVRIWDMGESAGPIQQTSFTAGNLLRSTFAHDGAILKVLYAPDGKTLYSTAEDRRIKAWDAATLTERLVFEPQSDWVSALALSPDGRFLAAGRYDASSAVYAANTGKRLSGTNPGVQVAAAPPPPEPETRKKVTSLEVHAVVIRATIPPSITEITPDTWPRGGEVEVTVTGKNLDRSEPVLGAGPVTARVIETKAEPEPEIKLAKQRGTDADIFDNARPYTLKLKIAVPADAPLGRHELLLRTPLGITNPVAFNVTRTADATEAEPNNSADSAQRLEWPAVIAGKIDVSGDVDHFRLAAKSGQELVFVLTESQLNPSLKLLDSAGNVRCSADAFGDPKRERMAHRVEANGDYVLEVSDYDLRSGLTYRLHIGEFPLVTKLWPMGVSAGVPQKLELEGFNLGNGARVEVDPPDAVPAITTMPLPLSVPEGSPISAPVLAVSPFPERIETEPNDEVAQAAVVEVGATVNAHLEAESDHDPDADLYRFHAQKDQTLVIETMSARLGSLLDTVVEVLDAEGKPLERGLARCVAETFLVLSGRDSKAAGLRLDNWRDLKIGDYVMVGAEVLQVRALPDYPDEDVGFKAYANGQRMGFFATTPQHHAVNAKAYRVEIHPPGTTFAPNRMPIFPLYWRNDDSFSGDGEASGDSHLEFTAPYDGDFFVRVRDAVGRESARNGYRLTLREPQPDFDVVASPYRVNIATGSRVPVEVRVRRKEGFSGEVRVHLHGLPEGFSAEPDTIPPGEERVRLALTAAPEAKSMPLDTTFRVTADSELNGQSVSRETTLGPITVIEVPPDVVVRNDVTQVAIAPGQSNWIAVHLERQNDFTSRVPIDVLNLPFGVRVMDTGLNGILVRDGENDRRMEIYVEPWVAPTARRIYIQALIEARSPTKPVFLSEAIDLQILPATSPTNTDLAKNN